MVLDNTFTVSVTLSRASLKLYTNEWSYYNMIESYNEMVELNSPSSVREYYDYAPDYEDISPMFF